MRSKARLVAHSFSNRVQVSAVQAAWQQHGLARHRMPMDIYFRWDSWKVSIRGPLLLAARDVWLGLRRHARPWSCMTGHPELPINATSSFAPHWCADIVRHCQTYWPLAAAAYVGLNLLDHSIENSIAQLLGIPAAGLLAPDLPFLFVPAAALHLQPLILSSIGGCLA